MRVCHKHVHPVSDRPTATDVALPPALPYPDGWTALAFSAELRPGTVVTRQLAGEDVVLYRMRNGRVRAVRPYCPHLGAHLGLASVEGNELVCQFHRFAFDADGTCVRTGYGTPPPKASLSPLPVREVNDVVFLWRHHDGREPDWEIPSWHRLGGQPLRHVALEMPGYAQDVMENSFDLGHFVTLHGWPQGELAAPVEFDGVNFHISMLVRETFPLLGMREVEVEVDGHGLAVLHTDVRTPSLGLEICSLVMPAQVAPSRMQLRQASRFVLAEPAGLPPALARVVSRSVTRLMAGLMFKRNLEFTSADFPIWSTKKYVSPPRLTSGDGPIGAMRHWARQFYPPDHQAHLPAAAGPADQNNQDNRDGLGARR
ncbi:Rieske 2Fe-2S domain-containing protein [Streptomyces sp. FH025]|uniref:Rieske 2Fe-2S domain-containing protein n=1 Tax=Streptomyces sp. FH025 TaxID=2815937 RepID=UPI001A9CC16C|nr:Rieske 2Fe-2S domain-containing protein [Streptomyces sp. FH025]MBO1418475.1 Rieske (2Fe-2S) protein [Streptomyces sp. FH025]